MRKLENIYLYLIVLVLSIGTILPLFNPGFFEFHDNTQIVRVFEMGRSLSDGMFPVRWVEHLGYGYGYPIFNFYAPFAYYIGGIFFLAGFNLLISTKIMFAVGILVSGISMFIFSKKFFGNIAGVVSALIYVYFPYHAINIYVRGAIGEFYAYAFLPIFFLGLFSLIELKKKKNIFLSNLSIIFAISFSVFLISISHNLSIFMLLIIFIPTLLSILAFSSNRKDVLFLSITSIIIGFSLSAFYTLPSFLEMRHTNISSQIGGGSNFKDHFVCAFQYLYSNWGFGGSVPGCIDGMSFKIGSANILFMIIAVSLLFYSFVKRKFKIEEKVSIIALLILAISFFLTLQLSEFIWKSIPYMTYLQFPWRFINFIALFTSFIVGYVIFYLKKFGVFYEYLSALLIIAITLFFSLKLFVPQYYVYFAGNNYINEKIIKFNISKISDEYMPRDFVKPKSISEVPVVDAYFLGNGKIFMIEKNSRYQKYEFNLKNQEILHINTAFFPAWKAFVNNKKAEIIRTQKGMLVEIPSGEGVFELKFVSTTIEYVANIITFITIIFGILVMIYSKINRYGK